MPPATTAIVPLSSAPSWAALSIPRARPDTTTRSRWPRSWARPRAKRHAAAEALRAPTIATAVGRAGRIALRDQQRRRILQLGQQSRIEALPERQPLSRRASRPGRSRARRVRGCTVSAPCRRRAARDRALRPAPRRRCRSVRPAGGYVTGPIPAVRTSLRRSTRSFDPYAWLGSFRRGEGYFRGASRDEQRETEQHWRGAANGQCAAVIGALTAAVIPATDDIRIVSSKSTQIAA